MIQQRILKQKGNIVLIDKLRHDTHIWILFLNYIVFEDSFSIQQVLFIRQRFLVRHCFFYSLGLSGLYLFLYTNIWTQDDNLKCFLDVNAIIRCLLKWTTLNKVNLLVKLQLLPLS